VLARAAIPAGTRVVVTRRSSEVHCSVTCLVDPGGGVGLPMSRAYAFLGC